MADRKISFISRPIIAVFTQTCYNHFICDDEESTPPGRIKQRFASRLKARWISRRRAKFTPEPARRNDSKRAPSRPPLSGRKARMSPGKVGWYRERSSSQRGAAVFLSASDR